jgi:hypothetical protein
VCRALRLTSRTSRWCKISNLLFRPQRIDDRQESGGNQPERSHNSKVAAIALGKSNSTEAVPRVTGHQVMLEKPRDIQYFARFTCERVRCSTADRVVAA